MHRTQESAGKVWQVECPVLVLSLGRTRGPRSFTSNLSLVPKVGRGLQAPGEPRASQPLATVCWWHEEGQKERDR